MGLAGCEITETRMKIERRYPEKLHFEGVGWDRTAACGIESESHNVEKKSLNKHSSLSSRVRRLQHCKAI